VAPFCGRSVPFSDWARYSIVVAAYDRGGVRTETILARYHLPSLENKVGVGEWFVIVLHGVSLPMGGSSQM